MDKEEAIKILRELHDKALFSERTALETLHPELKEESEDEKIRKSLIILLQHFCKGYRVPGLEFPVSYKDMLAWLEKQGNQKSKKVSIWKHWKDGIAGNGEGKLIYLIKNGDDYSLSSSLGFECDYILLSDLDNLMLEKQGTSYTKRDVDDAYVEGMAFAKNELEKQGEQKPILNVPPREVILSIWDLGNEWKELTNGCISTEYGTQLDYIQKHWHESEYYLREKQGEQKLPIEKLPEEMKTIGESLGFTTQKECDEYNKMVSDLIMSDDNKDKTKFKVGDWVVSSVLGTAHIIGVNGSNEYQLEYIDGKQKFSSIDYVNYEYDEWTIADAKDGDVLSNGKMIVIFKHFEEPSYRQHIVAYIGLDIIGNIQITDDTWNLGIDKTKPATKEQRDILFSKMKEAGYEWDAKKKELKKISQRMISAEAKEAMYGNPAWSEEDEAGLGDAMWAIEQARTITKDENDMGNLWYAEHWLKSLKERCTWKPSDEQMRALDSIAGIVGILSPRGVTLCSLYKDLEKLKGE